MEEPSEELRLAEAAAAGDAAAVEALLDRYLPDLRAFVRLRAGPLVRARESCSDLVQSVCREVLQKIDRFRHPSETAFKEWLFRTALRKLSNRRDFYLAERRDVLREERIGGGGSSSPLAESRLLDVYRSFTSPSHRAAVQDEVERIERAFDQLSEEEREVITLAHIVGLSRAEIAEQMGRTAGSVRVLLHRALAKVVDLIATDEERAEDGRSG